MPRPVYPIYVQEESIASLLNQLTDASVNDWKTTQTKKDIVTNAKGVSLTGSLFQVVGMEAKLSKDVEQSSDFSTEEAFALQPEHKAKQVRKILAEAGLLYDLNTCLARDRPFGSFVDFRFSGTLERRLRLVEIRGPIESCTLQTVCSPDYLKSQSFMFQAMRTKSPLAFLGFGIIISVNSDNRLIEVKSLLLSLESQSYRL